MKYYKVDEVVELIKSGKITDEDIENLVHCNDVIGELKDVLEIFDERRDNYNEATTKALVEEIAKIVWSKVGSWK